MICSGSILSYLTVWFLVAGGRRCNFWLSAPTWSFFLYRSCSRLYSTSLYSWPYEQNAFDGVIWKFKVKFKDVTLNKMHLHFCNIILLEGHILEVWINSWSSLEMESVSRMSLKDTNPFTWKVDGAIPPPGYIDLKNLFPIPEETYICPFLPSHKVKGRRFKKTSCKVLQELFPRKFRS